MKKEVRKVVYAEELGLESYYLQGTTHAFPRHVHEYYVLGLVESGQRRLFCNDNRQENCTLHKGDILLFNPGDNHACVQLGQEAFAYRGINISQQVMLDWTEEISGRRELPGFSQNVVYDKEISVYLRILHEMIMQGENGLALEEKWLFLLDMFIKKYAHSFVERVPECRQEIDKACAFMEQHLAEHIGLAQICQSVGLSKSALLRAFTRDKGLTPYRYLENIRINAAKKLLAQGVSPLEAAMRTGFADQSHLTNYFSRFIGLTPAAYREIFCQQRKTEK